MSNSKNIIINQVILRPSTDEHSVLTSQFLWRTKKQFVGDNLIVVADIKEPIWWNRPLSSDTLCKKEQDGLYSYNLPFLGSLAGGTDIYKTEYNLLLNQNSIPCAAHIQLDETWSDEQKELLKQMYYYCIYHALLDLGVNAEDLSYSKNDILYQGKKFVGGEKALIDNVYTEDLIITLQVLPEKDIFARLTGRYAHKRQITGIMEECPDLTKEAFLKALLSRLEQYVNTNF